MKDESIEKLTIKIDRLYDALMGDKLDRNIGYFEQIELNTTDIKNNTNEIEKIKVNNKTPWGKIAAATSAGLGLGSLGATKGGALIAKFFTLFT